MQTEIIRIIESGLAGQSKNVRDYTTLLIEVLKKKGEDRFAQRLERTLTINGYQDNSFTTLDEISSQGPNDVESKMSMLEITNPKVVSNLILDENISDAISKFINKINHKSKLAKYGIDSKMALLLYGPPGCGKTTIANYIAKESKLPLVTARLDTLVSSLLGSTAKNIRKVFEFTNNRPCILFIDEFDAIAKARDNEFEHGELKRVINSLLQSIDQYNNVLIAATNHSEILDSAIWRRFDNIIEVQKPSSPKFIVDLVDSIINEFGIKLEKDEKKKNKIIEMFEKHSPSQIRTILTNVISDSIIKDQTKIKAIDILIEASKFNNHGKVKIDDLILFLNSYSISQTEISEALGISLRKVKDSLSKI